MYLRQRVLHMDQVKQSAHDLFDANYGSTRLLPEINLAYIFRYEWAIFSNIDLKWYKRVYRLVAASPIDHFS